ncbi:MAG: KH domain-containing protein [Oscillospiraceae bacterium]|jgi:spoIIIJ-associated protein|nr:KH domain-containing protein [Oscillospiraceae bacterium]
MEKIFNAKTLDEARELAAAEFGVDELDIHFEIIEQPVKKLFGTKGEYRVRAVCDGEGGGGGNGGNNVGDVKTSDKKEAEKTPDKPAAAPLSGEEAKKYKPAVEYIENVLKKLGAEAFSINVKATGDSAVLDIIGDGLGIVIGRRGETLDSLQYLAILANNRNGDGEHSRLTVDCNGYREKRLETLETLAVRTSNKVIKQGRRITLEPMNPYERRVIHSKVSEIDGVFSNSIGEEPYRKVVISAEIPKRRSGQPGGDRRNAPNRGAVTGKSYKQSSGFSTSFEREYKKTPGAPAEISPETADIEKSASLYGKIEL